MGTAALIFTVGSAMTAKPAGSGNTGKIGASKIGALAGARAFPPLAVVMFHFSEGHHYSGFRPLDFLATRGYLWVEFFFVLSGFILTYAYWPRLKDLFAVYRAKCKPRFRLGRRSGNRISGSKFSVHV